MAIYRPSKKKPTSTSRVSSSLAGSTPRSGSGMAANASASQGSTPASSSSNTSYYQNRTTGQTVSAAEGSPVSMSQNYLNTTHPLKSGAGVKLGTINGAPAFDTKFTRGLGTVKGTPEDVRGKAPTWTNGAAVSDTTSSDKTTEGGITSGSTGAFTPGSFSSIATNSAFNPSGLGSQTTPSSMSPFNAVQLGQQSQAGTLTPESIAQSQLATSLGSSQRGLSTAEQDLTGTANFLSSQYSQGSDLISQGASNALEQADRAKEEALAENAIEQELASMEYAQALSTIASNREQENKYLMQKLASAGAIDSSAGVQIITSSAEKYDSTLANLAGQRNIALASFALADSKVRNTYATSIENISLQAQQLQVQLSSDLQSQMLEATKEYRGARDTALSGQDQAFTDYLSTLYGIQEARKEAEAAALLAAQEAQQKSFENAIAKAGLTGTFVDPISGEAIRTLNGLKFDLEAAKASAGSGSGSGSVSGTDLSALIQQGLSLGIIGSDQAQAIIDAVGSSKSGISQEAQIYAQMLSEQISAYSGSLYNTGLPTAVAGGVSQTLGLPTPTSGGRFGTSSLFPGTQGSYSYSYDASGKPTGSTASYKGSLPSSSSTPPATSNKPKSWNLKDWISSL